IARSTASLRSSCISASWSTWHSPARSAKTTRYPEPVAFTEVADRVWLARYPLYDVNITLVGGARGLLVVDPHGTAAASREVVADVDRLGVGPVTGVVNTHAHFDHVVGNGTFRTAYGDLPIVA